MLYGETGKRLTYIVYSFIIKLRNKDQYESQWIENNVGTIQNCGMFHYWKNQNQNMDIQLYQLMYKRTNQ